MAYCPQTTKDSFVALTLKGKRKRPDGRPDIHSACCHAPLRLILLTNLPPRYLDVAPPFSEGTRLCCGSRRARREVPISLLVGSLRVTIAEIPPERPAIQKLAAFSGFVLVNAYRDRVRCRLALLRDQNLYADLPVLICREIPRLCRRSSRSLTIPKVCFSSHSRLPSIREACSRQLRSGPLRSKQP